MPDSNVFVLGLDDFHRPLLEALPQAAGVRFHGLLERAELRHPERIPFSELLERAHRGLDAFDGSVDGIMGYWDFPVSCMVPILCAERGLPGPPLESVLRCEHKYWSRVLQREVAPEVVPAFREVDPFDDEAVASIDLEFPFWLKPVKSWNSYLGFLVEDRGDLRHAVERIRAGIPAIAAPFDEVLARIDRPAEIAYVDGRHCIAEAIISAGRQCTVEGWSFDGEVEVFGVVDSFRHPGMSTFSRYQYPSSLPDAVQKEISELSRRVVRHVGYEGAPFNIEYFWDEASGRIWLLEVNARISQSHSELFAHVDGAANHAVPLDLALGRRPRMPHRQGKNPCAAKFYERTFEDSVVTRAPPPEELRALEDRVGACRIHVLVSEGMRLSDLGHQESYSFEMAWIYVGGRDEADLLRKHEQVLAGLDIRLEPVGRESA